MTYEWIAGFLDADGCISCRYRPEKKSIQCVVLITNTNRDILEEIRDFTGVGSVRIKRRPTGNWKETYDFAVDNNRDIYKFLKLVYPHLKIKRRRAELLCIIVSRKRYTPYTEEEMSIVSRIKKLNK